MDARLRTDYNIAVGTREDEIGSLVRKSLMKRLFIEAGIPTARQHIISDLEAGQAFVKQVGYPVIVKPDIGVGANGTMKINGEDELLDFYSDPLGPRDYCQRELRPAVTSKKSLLH